MKEPSQPLTEIFGHLIYDHSAKAERDRSHRLCPFNNKVPIAQRIRQKILWEFAAFITKGSQ